MNNTFSFKRFGSYFCFDLKNAADKFLISMLILGTLPITIYMFASLMKLIIDGTWNANGAFVIISSILIALFTITISMPVKLYGGITDKKEGANYLMLPASTLEKFLSMMLVILVVTPVVFCSLHYVSSSLVGLVDSHFKETLIDFDYIKGFVQRATSDSVELNISFPSYLSWAEGILTFTLGAVFFKNAKVGKTIITLILLGMVFSIFSTAFISAVGFEGLEDFIITHFADNDPQDVLNMVMTIGNLSNILINVVLMILIYFRLRTIKL